MDSVRSVSRVVVLLVDVQLFQHHLLKRLTFLHCLAIVLVGESNWLYLCGSLSGLFILLHYLFVYSCANITLSWWLSFYTKSWSQIVSLLQLCSSSTVLAVLGLLSPYINVRISLPVSTKMTCRDFDWNCLECVDQVEKNWHLDTIKFSYP